MFFTDVYTPQFEEDMFAPSFVNDWNRMWFNFDHMADMAVFVHVRNYLDYLSGDDMMLRHALSFAFAIPFAIIVGAPIIALIFAIKNWPEIRDNRSYRRLNKKKRRRLRTPIRIAKEVISMPNTEETSDLAALRKEADARIRSLLIVHGQSVDQTTQEHLRQLDEVLDPEGPFAALLDTYDEKHLDNLQQLRDALAARLQGNLKSA